MSPGPQASGGQASAQASVQAPVQVAWRAVCHAPAQCRGLLRGSMTLQISLSVMAISVLLVAGSTWLILRLSKQDLLDVADAVMLGNLALVQRELIESRGDLPLVAAALTERIGTQVGSLHVAVVDEQRRTVAATQGFPLRAAELPGATVPDEALPPRIDPHLVRVLRERWGPLSREVRAADGTRYLVAMARIWSLPGLHPQPAGWAVMAMDTGIARELVIDSAQIMAALLAVSAGVSALAGVWLARRIVVAARQLGDTAARISGKDLSERLDVPSLPSELHGAAEALNHMLDRLDAAFTRLTQFSSDLAHDLRTPLNNLLGEAQVALSRPRSAGEYRAVIESAVEDCERLVRLTESLLFLARADEGEAMLRAEWIDVADLADRLRDYFEPLAEDRGLGLALRVTSTVSTRLAHGAAPRLWADRTLLLRAVSNLLNNALRHARPGSTLSLHLAAGVGGVARIAVGNEGEPIPVQYHQRIFERMFRADPSRSDSAGGAGLGLAIVHSIMELHGGSVAVRSQAGEPTVFTLAFPAPASAA
ncbi:heavy metal sensor histidine kinase [Aquabacterium sp. OR-4]|uniref:heavy metal sensor histidine kinase n=1 Tax=Aquabacterium sp. OR-4 TaxID=2978127 RepID=UPI0021B255F2|nr:heavy metal sensor histidine kinase [Aquabacterium sp. OR-4]MDT7837230.1 heavy metal sensor histidine kinase [Aquabacterium sp. OR-4]